MEDEVEVKAEGCHETLLDAEAQMKRVYSERVVGAGLLAVMGSLPARRDWPHRQTRVNHGKAPLRGQLTLNTPK